MCGRAGVPCRLTAAATRRRSPQEKHDQLVDLERAKARAEAIFAADKEGRERESSGRDAEADDLLGQALSVRRETARRVAAAQQRKADALAESSRVEAEAQAAMERTVQELVARLDSLMANKEAIRVLLDSVLVAVGKAVEAVEADEQAP